MRLADRVTSIPVFLSIARLSPDLYILESWPARCTLGRIYRAVRVAQRLPPSDFKGREQGGRVLPQPFGPKARAPNLPALRTLRVLERTIRGGGEHHHYRDPPPPLLQPPEHLLEY